MKKYSISLLYQNEEFSQFNSKLTTYLRVEILNANTEEEALGKSIKTFEEEMKKLKANLAIYVVLEIK